MVTIASGVTIKKYYWCLIHCDKIGKSIHNLLIKLEKKFLWICSLLRVFFLTNALGCFLCNIYHMPQPLNLNVEKSYQNEPRKYCYGGAWVAQWVKPLPSAQVIISESWD